MSNRIRELREERKITLRDLAILLHMSFSNIATLERGESQLREDTVKKFAEFFDVSSDYLLGITNDRGHYCSEHLVKNEVSDEKDGNTMQRVDKQEKNYNRLFEIRMAADLSLRELGEKTNISYTSLGAIENGKRPFTQEHLITLCNFFEVSSDYLLGLSDNKTSFSNRLRELRKERNLTLREVADLVHMSFSNVAMIERGERNFTADTLKVFSDFFNVSTDYLLCISDDRESNNNRCVLNDEIEMNIIQLLKKFNFDTKISILNIVKEIDKAINN